MNGTPNIEFVIFPPSCLVTENTFRLPWYRRNCLSEFMGLICREYDAKGERFLPGVSSLNNCVIAHLPDAETFESASKVALEPIQLLDSMAFIFESLSVIRPTICGMSTPQLKTNYTKCLQQLNKHFDPSKAE